MNARGTYGRPQVRGPILGASQPVLQDELAQLNDEILAAQAKLLDDLAARASAGQLTKQSLLHTFYRDVWRPYYENWAAFYPMARGLLAASKMAGTWGPVASTLHDFRGKLVDLRVRRGAEVPFSEGTALAPSSWKQPSQEPPSQVSEPPSVPKAPEKGHGALYVALGIGAVVAVVVAVGTARHASAV